MFRLFGHRRPFRRDNGQASVHEILHDQILAVRFLMHVPGLNLDDVALGDLDPPARVVPEQQQDAEHE